MPECPFFADIFTKDSTAVHCKQKAVQYSSAVQTNMTCLATVISSIREESRFGNECVTTHESTAFVEMHVPGRPQQSNTELPRREANDTSSV